MADPRRKRQAAGDTSRDLTWAALEAALGPELPPEPPPDSVTVAEFAARRGVSHGQAAATLRNLAKDGVLAVTRYRAPGMKPGLAYSAVAK